MFSASDTVHDTWITVNSKLVTSRYQAEFDHGEFCVDTELESGNIVAVMCDACKKGVSCFVLLSHLPSNSVSEVEKVLFFIKPIWPKEFAYMFIYLNYI